MAMISAWPKMEEQKLVPALQAASEQLNDAKGEVELDFSAVRRVDAAALKAMTEFADRADGKTVKVVLRGVNVDIYKVLKLVKLSQRFGFAN